MIINCSTGQCLEMHWQP